MDPIKLAVLWALALLGSALAARFGMIPGPTAEGLFYGLLVGAGIGLGQTSRCASC